MNVLNKQSHLQRVKSRMGLNPTKRSKNVPAYIYGCKLKKAIRELPWDCFVMIRRRLSTYRGHNAVIYPYTELPDRDIVIDDAIWKIDKASAAITVRFWDVYEEKGLTALCKKMYSLKP